MDAARREVVVSVVVCSLQAVAVLVRGLNLLLLVRLIVVEVLLLLVLVLVVRVLVSVTVVLLNLLIVVVVVVASCLRRRLDIGCGRVAIVHCDGCIDHVLLLLLLMNRVVSLIV